MNKTLVIVAGPTAVGKTAVTIQLAKYYNTEIISADSRQFYKELNIGVARPSEEELLQVKHHLIAHLSVHDYYNVSRFEQDALQCLENLFKTHDIVFMTGGSGMYLDVLYNGITEIPDADSELRNQLNEKLEKEGIESIQNQLKELDVEYYQKVDLQNPVRLLRAIEVCLQTGKPYSTFRNHTVPQRPFRILQIGLSMERALLNERINLRVEQMLENGLLKEAESLYSLRNLTALKTVGYTELFDYMNGIYTLEEAVEKIKTNTRRYAKRQMTWFRKNEQIQWFQPNEQNKIIEFIDKFKS